MIYPVSENGDCNTTRSDDANLNHFKSIIFDVFPLEKVYLGDVDISQIVANVIIALLVTPIMNTLNVSF